MRAVVVVVLVMAAGCADGAKSSDAGLGTAPSTTVSPTTVSPDTEMPGTVAVVVSSPPDTVPKASEVEATGESPAEAFVASVSAEPSVVEPNGILLVHVECVPGVYLRPIGVQGWISVRGEWDDGSTGAFVRPVSREEWSGRVREFTVEVDLAEQFPPGEVWVSASCDGWCCEYWTESSPVAVVDYAEGPSFWEWEPLRMHVWLEPVWRRGGEMVVDAACPVDAGVGNAHVFLLTNGNLAFDYKEVDYGVVSVTDVPASSYSVGRSEELAFVVTVPIPVDAPASVAVHVVCVDPRSSLFPVARRVEGTTPVLTLSDGPQPIPEPG